MAEAITAEEQAMVIAVTDVDTMQELLVAVEEPQRSRKAALLFYRPRAVKEALEQQTTTMVEDQIIITVHMYLVMDGPKTQEPVMDMQKLISRPL